MADEVAIGIDLGTTYCCIATYHQGQVTIIPNHFGTNKTPSYVTLEQDGEVIIGQPSKSSCHQNPERTIFDVKRLLGHKMFDTFVKPDMKRWPFQVVSHQFQLKIQIDNQKYSLDQITTLILKYLKETAEEFLGHPVSKTVLAVPPYFYDYQIELLRDAGEEAGLEILKVIQEPIASAVAYNHDLEKSSGKDKSGGRTNVLIFDLGGGALNTAIVSIENGSIDILAVDGHTHIGGEDFDNEMVEYCVREFKYKSGIDLALKRGSENESERGRAVKALRRLKKECESQKILLSATKSVQIVLESLYDNQDFSVKFDQELFNLLNKTKFESCIQIVERVVEASGLKKRDVQDIVVVGGSSRIPKVQQMLADTFGGKKLKKYIDPDTAVAVGAAIEAADALQKFKDGTLKRVEDEDEDGVGEGLFQSMRNMAVFQKAYENSETLELKEDKNENLEEERVDKSEGPGETGKQEGREKKTAGKSVNFQV